MQQAAWIVFDLGGVLFDFHGVAGVSELTGMSPEAAHDALVKSRAVRALETGEISSEVFGRQFSEELGLSISSPNMVEQWAGWEAGPKPGAVELLTSLRAECSIACLSNNNAINWAVLCEVYDANKLFDKCYLSHEIGLQKPDPRLFEHVVVDLDTLPTQITYFDDRADIVDSATAFGFNAFQVSGPADIRAVLGRS